MSKILYKKVICVLLSTFRKLGYQLTFLVKSLHKYPAYTRMIVIVQLLVNYLTCCLQRMSGEINEFATKVVPYYVPTFFTGKFQIVIPKA